MTWSQIIRRRLERLRRDKRSDDGSARGDVVLELIVAAALGLLCGFLGAEWGIW